MILIQYSFKVKTNKLFTSVAIHTFIESILILFLI